MKKLILLLSLCTILISCKEKEIADEYTPLLVKNYVVAYVDQKVLNAQTPRTFEPQKELKIDVFVYWNEAYECYIAPEFGEKQNSEKFLEIATRNKDNSYDKIRFWFLPLVVRDGPTAFIDNFSSINIVCTNAAWNDTHPKDTSLNDLTRLSFSSYYDFVQSGYANEDKINRYDKPLADLSPTDLYILDMNFSMKIDSPPTPGSYEVVITLTTVDGDTKTATCTLDVK